MFGQGNVLLLMCGGLEQSRQVWWQHPLPSTLSSTPSPHSPQHIPPHWPRCFGKLAYSKFGNTLILKSHGEQGTCDPRIKLQRP